MPDKPQALPSLPTSKDAPQAKETGEEWKGGTAKAKERLPEVQWAAIKVLSIRGVTDNELAERYNVTQQAIRVRRFRDPLWRAATKIPNLNNEPPKHAVTKEAARQVEAVISTNLLQNGERSTLLASQLATEALQAAADAPGSIRLASITDVQASMRVARQAAGMDKREGPTVSVALFGAFGSSWQGAQAGAVVEADLVEAGDDSAQE